MLQYVLCAARFAHYLNVIGRDMLGRVADRRQLQTFLNDWIQQHVAADPGASAEDRARYPLREAKIEVDEVPGEAGHFRLRLFLAPHVQLDRLSAGIKLVTHFP
jgi:type VI secretion system ImpC/EvpB family protein